MTHFIFSISSAGCAIFLCDTHGWEIAPNYLITHARFSPQLGEMRNQINAVGQFLIPPFPGSNPGAPASQSGLSAFTYIIAEKVHICDALYRLPGLCRSSDRVEISDYRGKSLVEI
jgi:hypothetical protein